MDKTLAIISPHFDDAALSCGGLIAVLKDAGWNVSVINVFTGFDPNMTPSDFACYVYKSSDVYSALLMRTDEDQEALSMQGVNTWNLGFPEACLRYNQNGDWMCKGWTDIFQYSRGNELALEQQVATLIAQLVTSVKINFLVWPSHRASHRDHAIVSYALEHFETIKAKGCIDTRSFFYEDLPYNAAFDIVESSLSLCQLISSISIPMERKLSLIRRYPRSLMVGSSLKALEESIVKHGQYVASPGSKFGERLGWTSVYDQEIFFKGI